MLVERLIDGVRAGVAVDELIAVGRRLGDPRGTGHAAGAADVLDHDLLSENLCKARCQDARGYVHASACPERHHHGHRASGPVLGVGSACRGQEHREHTDETNALSCFLKVNLKGIIVEAVIGASDEHQIPRRASTAALLAARNGLIRRRPSIVRPSCMSSVNSTLAPACTAATHTTQSHNCMRWSHASAAAVPMTAIVVGGTRKAAS